MSRMKKTMIAVSLLLVMVFGSVTTVQADAAVVNDPVESSLTTDSFTVEWDAVTDAYYYLLYYYPYGASQYDAEYIQLENETTYTFSNLPKDTVYYVAVFAYDSLGTYLGASENFIACVTKPGKLTKYKAGNWTKNSVQLTLTANPYPNTMNGVEYQIMNASGKVVKKGTMKSWPYTVTGLSATKLYKYRIRPVVKVEGRDAYYGGWSKTNWLVPKPIMNDLKTASKNRIKVSWKKISGATKYIVYGSTSPNSGYKKIKAVSGKKNSLVVSKVKGKKLKKYKNYYFKVIAYKGSVKSEYSDYVGGYIYTVYK